MSTFDPLFKEGQSVGVFVQGKLVYGYVSTGQTFADEMGMIAPRPETDFLYLKNITVDGVNSGDWLCCRRDAVQAVTVQAPPAPTQISRAAAIGPPRPDPSRGLR